MCLKTVFLVAACVICMAKTQNVQNNTTQASRSLDQFALNLLSQTADEAGDNLNIALSPFTIWTLLTIIAEGARGNTLRELENTLGLPAQNKDAFRNNFKMLTQTLKSNDRDVNLDFTNAIFTTNEFPLNATFQRISQDVYNVDVIPVDFRDTRNASSIVNTYIARATQNRIPNFVNPGDLVDAAIFMTSALFFKGQWRYPFNKTATRLDTFFDDSGRKIGQVEMMYQSGPFPYTLMPSLKAFVVELPYGDADKMSMILFVPRRNEKLSTVMKLLAQTPLSDILDNLARIEQEFVEEDVEVYMPKFSIQSELNLNAVLSHLGIRDVFSIEKADLLGMFPEYLYLSRVLQKAVIDVDEEGTVAAAAASGALAYKTMQPKLVANKPFVYLIVDKQMKSVVFAGKISNPNGICDKCVKN